MGDKKALISVFNKDKVIEFGKELEKLGYEILSTGNTHKKLSENGVKVTSISDYTESPELFGGRVKSLHPKIFAGILPDRTNKVHVNEMKEQEVQPIDIVAVNLYPFKETISKESVNVEEAVENIDIGGPSLIRAAAKNFKNVIVIVDPDDYQYVIDAIKSGAMNEDFRRELARKAFEHTAEYDTLINQYFNKLEGVKFPQVLNLTFDKIGDLRYGENHHQHGAAYREPFIHEACVGNLKQLHGKDLSYNNYLDLNDAFELVKDFSEPAAGIIKHTNPCGIAVRSNIDDAFLTAYEADKLSAFGSIVSLNRDCTKKIAEEIKKIFVEAVICPSFEKEALEILQTKKNIRLLETRTTDKDDKDLDMKRIVGGLLIQSREFPDLDVKDLKVVSKRKPTEQELKDMLFGFKVCKHVKSNAIVFSKNEVVTGVGAGQMSRVDSVKIACFKSAGKSEGNVMASDAFFPFRDGIDEAAKCGVTSIIQPGGSIRDQEVIDAADEHDMAMVFTGVRVFKH